MVGDAPVPPIVRPVQIAQAADTAAAEEPVESAVVDLPGGALQKASLKNINPRTHTNLQSLTLVNLQKYLLIR